MFGWVKKVGRYVHKVLVAVDQTGNVILTDGSPDETISSHSQRAADRGNPIGKGMTKFLHLFQKDHGHKAMHGDLKRAEEVEEIEKESLGDA